MQTDISFIIRIKSFISWEFCNLKLSLNLNNDSRTPGLKNSYPSIDTKSQFWILTNKIIILELNNYYQDVYIRPCYYKDYMYHTLQFPNILVHCINEFECKNINQPINKDMCSWMSEHKLKIARKQSKMEEN